MSLASKAKTKPANAKPKSSPTIWLIVGGVIIVLLVVLVLFLNNRPTATAVAQPDVPTEWIDGTSLGNPDAPVVIWMYEDFLCPACQQWTASVKPQLVENYIKTGKARLEFHQFPLQQHNPGAIMAAQASECAADQNMFWPYHDRVFQGAATRGQAGTTYEALVGYARELGLDEAALRGCMTNLSHEKTVVDALGRVQQLGLTSTPSILVNGRLQANPFNYNELAAAIDAAAGATE